VWEDYNENFTQDRIKSVKHYFQKKYNTTNVNVITKAKVQKEDGEQTVDVSVNIMDTNYQVELLKQFLTSKNYDKHLDDILNHNKMVENKKDISIEWVRDSFLIETNRRKSLEVSSDTSSQDDNTLFVIDTLNTPSDVTYSEKRVYLTKLLKSYH